MRRSACCWREESAAGWGRRQISAAGERQTAPRTRDRTSVASGRGLGDERQGERADWAVRLAGRGGGHRRLRGDTRRRSRGLEGSGACPPLRGAMSLRRNSLRPRGICWPAGWSRCGEKADIGCVARPRGWIRSSASGQRRRPLAARGGDGQGTARSTLDGAVSRETVISRASPRSLLQRQQARGLGRSRKAPRARERTRAMNPFGLAPRSGSGGRRCRPGRGQQDNRLRADHAAALLDDHLNRRSWRHARLEVRPAGRRDCRRSSP